MAIPTSYMTSPSISNDWAVLYVGTDLTNQGISGYFNFAVSPSSGTSVRFTGYHFDPAYNLYQGYNDCTISYNIFYPGRVKVSPCQLQSGGKSGGPVYVTSSSVYTVVTICSSGSSSSMWGPKLTSSIIAVFNAELEASLARNG